jgi:Na+/H+ antiporter NhaD/arsenite permease-like protein
LIRLISVPMERSLKVALAIFAGTLGFIAFHRRIEGALGLTPNTMLLIMPLMASGAIMIWKPHKAREYVERGVEWWTLLFFMLLFAQAGTLKFTGATDVFAEHFMRWGAAGASALTGIVLWTSSIGSSVLDNVVIVVTFASMITSFFDLGVGHERLWWALLMGGCLGGNITLIGSTANIVALGILEKEHKTKVRFRDWFGVGLTVGVLTTGVVWVMLLVLPMYR